MKGFIFVVVLVLISCKRERPTQPPSEQPPSEINYETHIQPIWDRSCISCHSGSSPSGSLDLSAGVSYSQLVEMVSPNYGVKRVRRGKPDSSVLYHKLINSGVYGGQMPPSQKLPDEEINLIKTWIEQLKDTITTKAED